MWTITSIEFCLISVGNTDYFEYVPVEFIGVTQCMVDLSIGTNPFLSPNETVTAQRRFDKRCISDLQALEKGKQK